MKDDTSLKESIATLAEMTRKSMEKDLQIKDVKDVNARWSPRHGWHLRRSEEPSNVWQDDYK